jgi:hypothetical protein
MKSAILMGDDVTPRRPSAEITLRHFLLREIFSTRWWGVICW